MNACAANPTIKHLGIIMDGNGRWAQSRCLPRTYGHKQGLEAVKRIVATVSRLGIPYLSLYTFSTENWKRAQSEVDFLMKLIVTHLSGEFDFYRDNRIRVVHSGRLEGLPPAVISELNQVAADTRQFSGLTVNLAINYGGRDEILRGLKSLVHDLVEEGAGPQDVLESLTQLDEGSFTRWLDTPDLPDLDLIIRTGGERRISNFLLWKSAYAELFFSDRLWPDYSDDDLMAAIADFRRRDRRFGAAPLQLSAV